MTVTVTTSSGAVGRLNDMDLGALDNLSFDFATVFASIGVLTGESAVTTLTSSELRVSESGVALSLLGSGFSPTSSLDDFGQAIADRTVTGTVSSLVISQNGTELLGLNLTASSYELRYGTMTLDIPGALPTSVLDLMEALVAIVALSEPGTLTETEIDGYTALLAAYSISGLTLSDGGTEVASLAIGTDALTLAVDDFTLTAHGTFPATLGGAAPLLSLLPALIGGTGTPNLGSLGGLQIDDLQLRAPDNSLIASVTGDILTQLASPTPALNIMVGNRSFDNIVVDVPSGGSISNRVESDIGRTFVSALDGNDTVVGFDGSEWLSGDGGDDVITAVGGNTTMDGGNGDDRLIGSAFSDTMWGGNGVDVIEGRDGNDVIKGGATAADLRDVVYGGNGNDSIDGGYGNDELRGDAGNDSIEGGFGVDTVIGGDGDDVLAGSALSDAIFGGNGNDFINGGFGFDRVNGGAGGDRFYHLGIQGHGSDWIQGFSAAEGDRLLFGGGAASASDFQVNFANTPNAGDGAVSEAFVIYVPTRQILWALVDGGAEAEINLQAGSQVFDLLS